MTKEEVFHYCAMDVDKLQLEISIRNSFLRTGLGFKQTTRGMTSQERIQFVKNELAIISCIKEMKERGYVSNSDLLHPDMNVREAMKFLKEG